MQGSKWLPVNFTSQLVSETQKVWPDNEPFPGALPRSNPVSTLVLSLVCYLIVFTCYMSVLSYSQHACVWCVIVHCDAFCVMKLVSPCFSLSCVLVFVSCLRLLYACVLPLKPHYSNATHHPVVDYLFIANNTLHCVLFHANNYIATLEFYLMSSCHIWLTVKGKTKQKTKQTWLTRYCWQVILKHHSDSLNLLYSGQENGKEKLKSTVFNATKACIFLSQVIQLFVRYGYVQHGLLLILI